jgi:hypothetical protein
MPTPNLNSTHVYSFLLAIHNHGVFTPRKKGGAAEARNDLYQRKNLSPSFFKQMLRNNQFLNTNVARIDMTRF